MASDDTINRFVTAADIMHQKRVAEAEARLTHDVWASRMSRRCRRAVICAAGFAVLGASSAATAGIVAIHADEIHQQLAAQADQQTQILLRALAAQDQTRQAEFASVLDTIRGTQVLNYAHVMAILNAVDPDYRATPEAQAHIASAGSAGTSQRTYAPQYQLQATRPAYGAPYATWPAATPSSTARSW